ncbi:hypothetical protein TWF694_011214 [Orbilia ellipsospora]|uniref:Uncharacterized protein n=1 Tax=Orbilia ellipsospora TaxID=2528407 RepID=A0AAV9X8R1_9PEZI
MATKRKLQLIALFSLSFLPVSVVCGRIPATIDRDYSQPFRTLMASLEILAATFASNALVLSSFLRDKGPKRAKFKSSSEAGESRAGRSIATIRNRSEAGAAYWGSDEDLVRDTGFALESDMGVGPMDRVPSRQPSNISNNSKKSGSPTPGLNRHFSSLSNRPRARSNAKEKLNNDTTRTLSPAPKVPPAHSTSASVRASNWGFPLEVNGLTLDTSQGVAVTTIETRYSPIEAETAGGTGPAFELGPLPPTITANGLTPRHSIGGGIMNEASEGRRSSSSTGSRGSDEATKRTLTSVSFSDVGGLLK